MKTPVYDGEEGKISPSCPIWEPTLGVSMLLEKAALRRLILPAVLRELFLTGCGRSSTLRRNLLLLMVTRFYCWRGCLSKKGPPHTTCNPTRMLCHKHVNEMLVFFWKSMMMYAIININKWYFVSMQLWSETSRECGRGSTTKPRSYLAFIAAITN